MKINKHYLVFFVLITAFFISGIYLPKSPFLEKEILFQIKKGEGSRDIALNLEREGLICWGPLLRIYVFITNKANKLQAGSYFLSPSMNIPEIAGKLSRGETAKTKVVIPEGFTSEQIFQKLIGVSEIDLMRLKDFEGYLFPDTYLIPYGAGEEEIIKMMVDNFNKKVTADLQEEMGRQKKEVKEIVIMASLLEKEVKTKEEKELASDVLWKRLKIGMALQVDSAMETYQRRGLPENPICNPGLESIQAAIYPKTSPYWYYLSTSDGKTIFSKTLEEHNIAKAKYLK